MGTDRRTMKCIGTIFATIAFWGVLCQQNGFAQITLRSLTGTVNDQHQVPLKGAVVQVRNEDTKGVVSYITGVDGRYSFKRIQGEADYVIWAMIRGRRSKRKHLSHFDPSKAKAINFTIRLR